MITKLFFKSVKRRANYDYTRETRQEMKTSESFACVTRSRIKGALALAENKRQERLERKVRRLAHVY